MGGVTTRICPGGGSSVGGGAAVPVAVVGAANGGLAPLPGGVELVVAAITIKSTAAPALIAHRLQRIRRVDVCGRDRPFVASGTTWVSTRADTDRGVAARAPSG